MSVLNNQLVVVRTCPSILLHIYRCSVSLCKLVWAETAKAQVCNLAHACSSTTHHRGSDQLAAQRWLASPKKWPAHLQASPEVSL